MTHLVRLAAAGLAMTALLPATAHAGACEDTFVRRGNAITGLRYVATVSVPDMPPDVAINQMRGIVARKGYDIMASEPAAGALLIEQPVTGKTRAFPIEINAVQTAGIGTVTMEAKMRAGQSAPLEGARTEMCGILAELKGGRAGRTAAAAGSRAVTQQAAPVEMTAQSFSSQISKDAERNAGTIAPRYEGKQFTLSGEIKWVTREGANWAITYKILQPHEMVIRLPGMAATLSQVSCLMAPGTTVYTMQQKPGNSVRLTGTFSRFLENENSIWLRDCTPVQRR